MSPIFAMPLDGLWQFTDESIPSAECAVVATCEFWRARRIEHDLALLCVQGDPGG